MKITKILLCCATGLCLCSTAFAQMGEVKTKTTYVVDSKGKKLLDSKEERDDRGRVVKEYEYDDYGDLKKYYVYEYKGKKVTVEYEYSPSGKLKEKAVNEYNEAGKRVAKVYYDAAGKVVKKKVYEYTFYAE